MHFALQIELGRFVLTAGLSEDAAESDEDGFYWATEPGAIDDYPEDADELTEHRLPLGFHTRELALGEEEAT